MLLGWSKGMHSEVKRSWLPNEPSQRPATRAPRSSAVWMKLDQSWPPRAPCQSEHWLSSRLGLTYRLVVDGFQPVMRGSTRPGRNLEMQLIKIFPDAALFIEKPISSSEFSEVDKVKEALKEKTVSVGYMLRYLKGMSGHTSPIVMLTL